MKNKAGYHKIINYGIDAPYTIIWLFISGVLLLLLASTADYPISSYFLNLYERINYLNWLMSARTLIFVVGSILCLEALLMILSSTKGKILQRDKLLNLVRWQGNELILDIGCGRGLLLIGAAKKLTTCKAFGIDLWNSYDLSGNLKKATINNIQYAQLENKVEIKDGDARNLPFENESFDVVMSSMVIHNISTKTDREKALKEMLRVTKKGGIILVQDFLYTKEYAHYFLQCNAKSVTRSKLQWFIFPPVRIVSVYK